MISSVLGHTIGGPTATRIYERHARIPEMRRTLKRWAAELERIASDEQDTRVVAIS